MLKKSRIIFLLLAFCMFFSISKIESDAASKVKYKNLVIGESFQFQEFDKYTKKGTVYKLSLKNDSIVKIKTYKPMYMTIHFYSDKNLSYEYGSLILHESKDITLSCGKYYIGIDNHYTPDEWKIKFNITPYTKYKDRKNYSRASSFKLKPKTWETVNQTPNNNYVRWYRISVPKKQIIHIARPKDSNLHIQLFNSRMEEPPIFEYTNKDLCQTQGKQPKGTYYIRISSYSDQFSALRLVWDEAILYKFKWY